MIAPHSIEPELQKPPPRAVKRRDSVPRSKIPGCIGCFLIPHTLVGLGMIGWFLWTMLILIAGQSVPAQITGRYTDRDSDGDTVYHLWYSYSHNGESYEKKASVNSSSYGTYTEGSSVTVKVFPLAAGLAPRLNVPGNKGSMHPLLLLGMALFWNGIVSIFWWQFLGRPLLQKRLIQRGVPVAGRVLFKRVVTGSYGDSHYVRYEYFPREGQFGPLPAIFETAAEDTPPAAATAPAISSTSPFTTSTADTGPTAMVTNIGTSTAPQPGWRAVYEQAKQRAAIDDARSKALASPGALSNQEPVDAKDFAGVQPGSWITVLHDPRNPKRAVAYPFSAYEAV